MVRSVTGCLQHLHSFAMVPFDVLEEARVRGTYVHDMTVAFDNDDLRVDAVQPIYLPYLAAWQSFLRDYRPIWSAIEQMGYSEAFDFAGTEDRRGTLEGPGCCGDIFGLDIKTAKQSHRVWGLQLAAYRQLAIEKSPRAATHRRATVQLWPDGTYKFTEWREPSDWPAFASLLTLINWSSQ